MEASPAMYQRLSVLLLALLLIAGGVAAAQDAGEWSPVISSRMPIISIVTDDGGSHFATAWVREDKLRQYLNIILIIMLMTLRKN